jgi:hypothetical protein
LRWLCLAKSPLEVKDANRALVVGQDQICLKMREHKKVGGLLGFKGEGPGPACGIFSENKFFCAFKMMNGRNASIYQDG